MIALVEAAGRAPLAVAAERMEAAAAGVERETPIAAQSWRISAVERCRRRTCPPTAAPATMSACEQLWT